MRRGNSRHKRTESKITIVGSPDINSVDGVNQYVHSSKKRPYNPPVGLVTVETDKEEPKKKYMYDPHLDPVLNFDSRKQRDELAQAISFGLNAHSLEEAKQALEILKKGQDPYLNWAGKAERTSFEVDTVSLHVHERIDPLTIMEKVIKKETGLVQMSLFPYFDSPENNPPLREAIHFYKHSQNWSNRLIAGDSLLVMNSLLQKESMSGKVQMIYVDPPYGVHFSSNFQPFVNKREVHDKDEDLTQEPEMVKAFRDTWELGIHSYLTYLRDRLLLSRDLLSDSGSIFVQISDENVHHVRELMDEVFRPENFVSQIAFQTTPYATSNYLAPVYDILIWYAKDYKQMKYHQLFLPKESLGSIDAYHYIDSPDGSQFRTLTDQELSDPSLIPKGWKRFQSVSLISQGASATPVRFEFEGKNWLPPSNSHWKITLEGLQNVKKANRLFATENSIRFKSYLTDFPITIIHNIWTDMITGSFTEPKRFVVQTNPRVIERCILMTSDPGDLILDPTCGSGTTAYVAEKWGRRWITCDTSRIAIALTKQRLITSTYSYYQLAHPDEGVSSGFDYETVPHITLSTIANNEPSGKDYLYDRPKVDRSKKRITGPFTIEAVPSQRVFSFEEDESLQQEPDTSIARSGESAETTDWVDELRAGGIRGKSGQKIEFSRLEHLAATRYLHAEGETKDAEPKRIVVSFSSPYTPMGKEQVELAIEEAQRLVPKPKIVVFASFQFDPEAARNIDETDWPGVTLLKVQMNTDLLTHDLRKKHPESESFWLVGKPDVELKKKAKSYILQVKGFDYYNPANGDIESGDIKKIAMWMLDTDYDGRSLYPRQVFFPMAGEKDGWGKLAKSLKAELDEDALTELFKGDTSLPFELGNRKRIAVKIIDDRGIESMRIVDVTD